MSLKRILSLLLLVTLSLFVISACSDETDSDASGRTTDNTSFDWSNVDWNSVFGGESESENVENSDEVTNTTENDENASPAEDESESADENESSDPVGEGNGEGTSEQDPETEDTENEGGNTTPEEDEEEAEVVDNSYTVTRLDIVYNSLTTSSSDITDNSLYYNANNLALSYNNGSLTVVGKIEIFTPAMAEKSNFALNKLRYRYFNETIKVSSIESLYTNNNDGTYTFVYPFALSGDDKIVYSANSSNKLTFTLTNKAIFPRDEASFVAKENTSMLPVQFYLDPYSIQGTYEQKGTCTGQNYSGRMDGGYYNYTINITNVSAKIDDDGNLDFTFTVSGYSNGANVNHNGSYAFSIDLDTWWGQNSSFEGSQTYNTGDTKWHYTDTIIIKSTSSSNTINLNVLRKGVMLGRDKTAFACDFTKISD